MDINSWGQSFLARIKALPGQAGDLAGDLPNTLKDGAQAVLANQEVADGMRTVGRGVGELVGWRSGDQVNLSDGAKGVTPGAPNGTPEAPKDPIGDAVHTGADTPGKVNPTPVDPKPAPAPQDPVGKAIRDAADKTPKVGDVPNPMHKPAPAASSTRATRGAARTTTTTVEIRDVKTTIRVSEATSAAKVTRASRAARSTRLVPSTEGIKGPVKIADAPKIFQQTSAKMNRLADALEKTQNPEQAQVLRQFAQRVDTAAALHAEGNTPAAFRMLHASNKLGLRNPAVQDAIRQGNKAEEVMAAFGKKTAGAAKASKATAAASAARAGRLTRSVDGVKGSLKIAGTPQFEATAAKMNRLASALEKTGNPEPAQVLRQFADRVQTAGVLHAEGNGPAAFRMLHASNKLGLRNPAVQDALKQGNKAEEVLAAFGKKTAGAAKATRTAKAATGAARGGRGAVAAERAAQASKTITRAGRASRSASIVIDQSEETITTVTRSTRAAGRVASGARAARASKAVSAAASGTEKAGVTLARSARGARAAKNVAETSGRVARGARAAANASKEVAAGGKALEGAAADGHAVGVMAGDAGEAAHGAEEVVKDGKAVGTMAGEAGNAAKAAESAGGIKGFFSNIGSKIKGFFGNFGKGGSSGGWATIKEGFGKMLPGLGKALKSSAIFSAVFAVAENTFKVFKGEITWQHALGCVLGDTLGGAIGGVFSAIASGGAIAALGALGLAGLPLTLAAGAIGIGAFMLFDHGFRNSSIYDTISHLFT